MRTGPRRAPRSAPRADGRGAARGAARPLRAGGGARARRVAAPGRRPAASSRPSRIRSRSPRCEPAQLVNVIFGNSSLHADVECVDVDVRRLAAPRAARTASWDRGPAQARRRLGPSAHLHRREADGALALRARRAVLHVRVRWHRRDQGRSRSRGAILLSVRGARAPLPRRGRARGPRNRTARALRAEPDRNAGSPREGPAPGAGAGRAGRDDLAHADRAAGLLGALPAARWGARARAPGLRRRAADRSRGALRPAVPAVRRRCRDLRELRQPLRRPPRVVPPVGCEPARKAGRA